MRRRFTAGLLSLAMVGALAAPITANAEEIYTGSFSYGGNEYSTSLEISADDKAALEEAGVDFSSITFDSSSSSDSSSSWSSISSSGSTSYTSSPVVISASTTLGDLIGKGSTANINGQTLIWQIIGFDNSVDLTTKLSDLTN